MSALAKVLRPLDPNDSQPLYQQVQRVLRDAIDKRILAPDDALPAERELAAELAVSRITIRKAIDGLVKEGLLVNRPGSGNFVSGLGFSTYSAQLIDRYTAYADVVMFKGEKPAADVNAYDARSVLRQLGPSIVAAPGVMRRVPEQPESQQTPQQ